jgi:hypothetical protein
VGTVKSFKLLVAIGVAALGASLLVLAAAVEPAQATFPGKNGRIAYQSTGGDSEIYSISESGGTPTQLTDNATEDSVSRLLA